MIYALQFSGLNRFVALLGLVVLAKRERGDGREYLRQGTFLVIQ